jgi:hypothetical protein
VAPSLRGCQLSSQRRWIRLCQKERVVFGNEAFSAKILEFMSIGMLSPPPGREGEYVVGSGPTRRVRLLHTEAPACLPDDSYRSSWLPRRSW